MKVFAILSAISIAASASNLAERDENSTKTSVVTATGLPLAEVSVLLTIIPSSILALAATNPASASAILQSEFASETPSWFTQLPSTIATYFLTTDQVTVTPTPTVIVHPSNVTLGPGPVITSATPLVHNTTSFILPLYTTYMNGSIATNGTIIANNGTIIGGGNGTAAGGNTTAGGHNSTASRTFVPSLTTASTSSRASSSRAASSSSSSSPSSSSTGAAALPTAVVGAAVVGAMGMLGMLAL